MAVVVASVLFALVHAPNMFLMLMTCVGALGWCAIYTRFPNILPLGVSHALATLALLYAFDDDITGRLRIGQAYLRLGPDAGIGTIIAIFFSCRRPEGSANDCSIGGMS